MRPLLVGGTAVAVLAGWALGAFDGAAERAKNFAAGIGPWRDDEVGLGQIRHLGKEFGLSELERETLVEGARSRGRGAIDKLLASLHEIQAEPGSPESKRRAIMAALKRIG